MGRLETPEGTKATGINWIRSLNHSQIIFTFFISPVPNALSHARPASPLSGGMDWRVHDTT